MTKINSGNSENRLRKPMPGNKRIDQLNLGFSEAFFLKCVIFQSNNLSAIIIEDTEFYWRIIVKNLSANLLNFQSAIFEPLLL